MLFVKKPMELYSTCVTIRRFTLLAVFSKELSVLITVFSFWVAGVFVSFFGRTAC